MDLQVKVVDGCFQTDLYTKKTDCHQYLHFESCHPQHTKASSIYSQALRLRRLCSEENVFKSRLSDLKQWFLRRGYPLALIKKQIERLNGVTQEIALRPKERLEEPTGVPFVVTYNPSLSRLGRTINALLPTLYADKRVKEVFTPRPFVSYRSGRSLKGHLVRSKLYPMERLVGCSGCRGNNCAICKLVKKGGEFESSITKSVYKINHKFNCNSKCVVYLLRCKVCNKQYVGQTSDKFRKRWNNYVTCQRNASNGGSPPQLSFHLHFLGPDHNGLVNDIEISFIDKTDPSDPLKREKYWIDILETMSPKGLNEGESV